MALSAEEREYIVRTAVDLLRHRSPERVLTILADRLAQDDYDSPAERELDEVALAIARAIHRELEEPTR
ncbi:MAG: hypothetical protein JRI23_09510 [Deltaproteobacteria bacterium]|nr:hypothetical protein [Deltaproteobacteria bacterium]MBW2531886.1 hypothetical protein [Deltaproteobacteria bacterium]